jgi:hypothetical protein
MMAAPTGGAGTYGSMNDHYTNSAMMSNTSNTIGAMISTNTPSSLVNGHGNDDDPPLLTPATPYTMPPSSSTTSVAIGGVTLDDSTIISNVPLTPTTPALA